MPHDDIRIGTLAKADCNPASYIRQILPYGFESFQITFPDVLDGIDLKRLATEVGAVLDEHGGGAVISSLGIYGNPP